MLITMLLNLLLFTYIQIYTESHIKSRIQIKYTVICSHDYNKSECLL